MVIRALFKLSNFCDRILKKKVLALLPFWLVHCLVLWKSCLNHDRKGKGGTESVFAGKDVQLPVVMNNNAAWIRWKSDVTRNVAGRSMHFVELKSFEDLVKTNGSAPGKWTGIHLKWTSFYQILFIVFNSGLMVQLGSEPLKIWWIKISAQSESDMPSYLSLSLLWSRLLGEVDKNIPLLHHWKPDLHGKLHQLHTRKLGLHCCDIAPDITPA
jgi:hypothetical protein